MTENRIWPRRRAGAFSVVWLRHRSLVRDSFDTLTRVATESSDYAPWPLAVRASLTIPCPEGQ